MHSNPDWKLVAQRGKCALAVLTASAARHHGIPTDADAALVSFLLPDDGAPMQLDVESESALCEFIANLQPHTVALKTGPGDAGAGALRRAMQDARRSTGTVLH